MNKMLLILLIFLPFVVLADLGSVVLFKAKFVLKNGQSFVGFYELGAVDNYESFRKKSPYCSDIGFQKLLNQKATFNNNKVNVIKEYYVEPKTNFAFSSNKQLLDLHLDSLKYTIFYNAFIPNFYFKEINVVEESVYDIIKNHKVIQYVNFCNGNADANVLSFNTALSWKEVAKMTAGICEYLMNLQTNEKKYSQKVVREMEAKIKALEQQNIYFFTYYFTC